MRSAGGQRRPVERSANMEVCSTLTTKMKTYRASESTDSRAQQLERQLICWRECRATEAIEV